ncbi:Zinc finger, C2H2-type/integrase, DNA-binding protein [Aspergillus terreus]|uniref:Zinc finger, C2H2-type/integrase, DNA-binding protein n=1 Tax=Aspergillus terreus TaxID=33178 RepID=A0A5M3YPY1_ASPTE|nr:hypothetical protein ATETN484_0001036000 [Aspergillus terreus]GFF12216.1 Zinc finger, C2H2-type/integrase, DNA-binding protein [Aspergillus terreus]
MRPNVSENEFWGSALLLSRFSLVGFNPPVITMASSHDALELESESERFRNFWTKKDQKNFAVVSFEELEKSIGDLQRKQDSQRRLQDLSRMGSFLKALNQYREVVEEFFPKSDIIPFLCGPIKLLLNLADEYEKAFDGLLDVYKRVGESLPLLSEYKGVFHARPHTVRVLLYLYKDILQLHRDSLIYFRQPKWKNLFDETWKTYSSRFDGLILNLARHGSLIEKDANPSEIDTELRPTPSSLDSEMRVEDLTRSNIVSEYGDTGRWLLNNPSFQRWFDRKFPEIPPLLWLRGIPGAGKTILASLIVEEAQKLTPTPTVLFFYCKYQNPERDNFLALARSLLAQFLKQNPGLLLHFYQKCCNSGEALLTSQALARELLDLAFSNCNSAYIIIDGLDECERGERKSITKWFRTLVEDLPAEDPDRFHCLFVSQDDGVARKDLSGIETVTIRVGDNQPDIHRYSLVEAGRLRERLAPFCFITFTVWINLAQVTSMRQLNDELDINVFPKGIDEAYQRIMKRMEQQSSAVAMKDTLMLLGWLVCAKRPLKWHEIQGLKSINLDTQSVDFGREGFVVAPKDLCGSLVEVRSDGTLEFVHLTTKLFLAKAGHIDPAAEEIKLASLCIDYLNLPAFLSPPTEQGVLNGDYVFMDYAVLYWIRHLEAGAVRAEGKDQLMKDLAESLEIFIGLHWASPRATLEVSDRIHKRLQFFQDLSLYDKLAQTVVSARKQLRCFGPTKQDEIALDLVDIVQNVRGILERTLSSQIELQQDVAKKYGNNLFKCPRFSCHFFPVGFPSADERDKHIQRHDRPFRCTNETCPSFVIGFTSATDREKHMKEIHSSITAEDEEFPTEQEVQRSMDKSMPENDVPTSTDPIESSESETEAIHQHAPRPKRQRQTQFVCEHCSKVFGKRYNWQSHLRTHLIEQPCKCPECEVGFARLSDLKRHMRTSHMNARRADILRKHHTSRVGRACLDPFLRDQEQAYSQAQYPNGQQAP